MNNEAKIKNFLLALSEAFPGVAKTSTLEIYYQSLKEDLKNQDLLRLQQKLINECEFFPTVKKIRDSMGLTQEDPRALATEFVDTVIAIFQGPGNAYEKLGSANYNFWIKTVGVTRFDLANLGDVKFHRSAWIDRIERAYRGENNVLKFEAKNKVAELVSSAINKGDNNEGA